MLSSLARVAVACSLLLTLAAPAAAQDAPGTVPVSDKARELFRRGVDLLEHPQGPRYAEAYRAFKAAYEDSPSPRILGNLGLCAAELERDGEAITAYRAYLAKAEIDAEERKDIEAELQLLERGKAELKLVLRPQGVVVVDERTPMSGRAVVNRYGPFDSENVTLVVRSGDHKLTVKAPDGRSEVINVKVTAGDSQAAQVDLDGATPSDDPEVVASDAGAAFPLAYVQRPMTLPERTLAPGLGFRFGRVPGSAEIFFALDLITASYGILDWLTVDIDAMPLQLQPEVDYGTSGAGVKLRFFESVVELGTGLHLGHFRSPGERHFFITPSILEALVHIEDWARFDTAFHLNIVTRTPLQIGMDVPMRISFQPVDEFYLGAATGVGIVDFDFAKETFFIPLGAFVGASIPAENGPRMDLEPSFTFHQLFVPGGQDKFVSNVYTGALNMRLYFGL